MGRRVEEQAVLAVHLLHHCVVSDRAQELWLVRVRKNVGRLALLCCGGGFVLHWTWGDGLIDLARDGGAGWRPDTPSVALRGVAIPFRIHDQQLKLQQLLTPLSAHAAFRLFCFTVCFFLDDQGALLASEVLARGQNHTSRGHHIADLGIEVCVDPSLGASSLGLDVGPLTGVRRRGSFGRIKGCFSVLELSWEVWQVKVMATSLA